MYERRRPGDEARQWSNGSAGGDAYPLLVLVLIFVAQVLETEALRDPSSHRGRPCSSVLRSTAANGFDRFLEGRRLALPKNLDEFLGPFVQQGCSELEDDAVRGIGPGRVPAVAILLPDAIDGPQGAGTKCLRGVSNRSPLKGAHYKPKR